LPPAWRSFSHGFGASSARADPGNSGKPCACARTISKAETKANSVAQLYLLFLRTGYQHQSIQQLKNSCVLSKPFEFMSADRLAFH
jgi:hypothetical protein